MSDIEEALDEEVAERRSVEDEIAEALSELSAADDAPTEVDSTSQFDKSEVSFDDDRWLQFVIRVQDWLRLTDALDASAPSAEIAASLFQSIGVESISEAFALDGSQVVVTTAGLDRLRDRVVRAVELRSAFEEALEATGSRDAASQMWIEQWDGTVEDITSEPVVAKALTMSISDFAARAQRGRLNLSPSYQRGDVWPTKDAQLLIESILRGIPLPSVIILRPSDENAPFEVVDGKQRLTSILRFMGAHPEAVHRVEVADNQYPGHNLKELFHKDYARFRTAWKNATGETLSGTLEREYYFPFKLSTTSSGLRGDLERLRGRYYCNIKRERVRVGGEQLEVEELFETSVEYKLPVIEYTSATPRQVHDVFNLYNKQGKHLNAEEIRNALYHHVPLMRALAVSAGDNADLDGTADFLKPIEDSVGRVSQLLTDYRFGDARYRRTKVLSWLFSVLFVDSTSSDGSARKLSTARQIDFLLTRVEEDPQDPFRNHATIRDAIVLVEKAMEAHSAADAWSPSFRDGRTGSKWQELQLIASLLGVALATAVVGDDIEELLIAHEGELRRRTETDWQRPRKTQTGVQWEYIAKVALSLIDELGISRGDVTRSLTTPYGYSSVPTLEAVLKRSRP